MELTVAEVLESLKDISKRQQEASDAEERLMTDVRKVDQQAKLLLSSETVTDEDREKLIEGLSNFVADTYKRAVARSLRAQGRAALADDGDEQQPSVELDLTGGGFPRMA